MKLSSLALTVRHPKALACRYDGFEAALQTATQVIADTAEDLAKPLPTTSQKLAARSEEAKAHLKTNFQVRRREIGSFACL